MKRINAEPSVNDKGSSVSTSKQNPLVGLYEFLRGEISEEDAKDAIQQLHTINDEQTAGFVQKYASLIDVLRDYGEENYNEENRVWFRCPSCRHVVWVAKIMGAFNSFPACFQCQMKPRNFVPCSTCDTIPEVPLD